MLIKSKNFVTEIKNGILCVFKNKIKLNKFILFLFFYLFIFLFIYIEIQILPERLLKIFNSNELELLINGQPFIDLDDWRLNTIYKGYNSNNTVN